MAPWLPDMTPELGGNGAAAGGFTGEAADDTAGEGWDGVFWNILWGSNLRRAGGAAAEVATEDGLWGSQ